MLNQQALAGEHDVSAVSILIPDDFRRLRADELRGIRGGSVVIISNVESS